MSESVCRWATGFLVVLLLGPGRTYGAGKPVPPDLTAGGSPDKSHDWTLGPTGARGWIWGWQGHTTDARQILITEVAASSPADGTLVKDDVLVGVDGKEFDSDARLALARAIARAESPVGGGVLRLIRWRTGKREAVQLKLPVLGAYAATAPFACPKSKRIFEQGCEAIARAGLDKVTIPNCLNALALLAGGKAEHRELVAAFARKVAEHKPGGHISWPYAYETLFLAEYSLATRDASVAAGLKRLATDIAGGQSGVGTWGHAFAEPNGVLGGYGAMNQPGIVLTLAMVLAREAGVKTPLLDKAIDKSARFLGWYVNKGAVPYGDHDPWAWHEDNGKCSSAAVLFDLLGQGQAARYFSRMGTAAYAERESGHTGCFFNILWAMPGVSRCGPAATAAYFREVSWYYDLARTHDGRMVYQPAPGDFGGHSYNRWDCTGAYLLGYALPLRSLYITGKKPASTPPLTPAEVDETIAAGRDFTFWTEHTAYDGRDLPALARGLASWSPAVRKRSAQALAKREGDFVPTLVRMLGGSDANARYGALETLYCLGPRADAAATELRKALGDRDPWVRALAALAVARLGEQARQAASDDLLRCVARSDLADPRGRVNSSAGVAVFRPGPGKREPRPVLTGSLDRIDRSVFYPAVRNMLANQDGRVRTLVSAVYDRLSPRDVALLMPQIVQSIREPAPSGEMFSDGIRMAGLELLARYRIREGLAWCVDLMEPDRWGQDDRVPRCLKILARYGPAAAEMLPRLREIREAVAKKDRRRRDQNPTVQVIDKAIAQIEKNARQAGGKPAPPLRTLAEFVRSPG
ncbi:MAG: hypothetical protein BWX88_02916 [Planctomycetes bacterium ADurb.Bin126]|nr:MAG: hypothetical protein BWX88_02916 [Planctomycetes bacterium ADurb.Bin126]HOD83367.1 DUF6288 domain-containing protein [Phycisphaerae bacterium]HQL74111.1 DUF6288 domain-containing protein [Phycisphaerae bacterium]